MERESILENQQNKNRGELGSRFMQLMEMRHRNAVTVLGIERILAFEQPSDEYPSIQTLENLRIKNKAGRILDPVLKNLNNAGLTRKSEYVKEAVDLYLKKKIEAQIAELQLKEKLQPETREATPAEMGSELFKQRTGEKQKASVRAERSEGYFILFFSDKGDYLKFAQGVNLENSGGLFHRAMRFPNMTVDVILCNRFSYSGSLVLHERQHFINGSILRDFSEIEGHNVLPNPEIPLLTQGVKDISVAVVKGLASVKDELLARIREGLDANGTTEFFSDNLYTYLREKFSLAEQKEVEVLLKAIELELKDALGFFSAGRSRGVLVYHLVDIPLLRFPERIKAIGKFYNYKISEFTDLIPNKDTEDRINSKDIKEELEELRLNITFEAYTAAEMILDSCFGEVDIGYDELQIKLKDARIEIEKLRKDYDTLLLKNEVK